MLLKNDFSFGIFLFVMISERCQDDSGIPPYRRGAAINGHDERQPAEEGPSDSGDQERSSGLSDRHGHEIEETQTEGGGN